MGLAGEIEPGPEGGSERGREEGREGGQSKDREGGREGGWEHRAYPPDSPAEGVDGQVVGVGEVQVVPDVEVFVAPGDDQVVLDLLQQGLAPGVVEMHERAWMGCFCQSVLSFLLPPASLPPRSPRRLEGGPLVAEGSDRRAMQ